MASSNSPGPTPPQGKIDPDEIDPPTAMELTGEVFEELGEDSFEFRSGPPIGSTTLPGDSKTRQATELPERIGDYKILHLIGSGGMGDVFLAEHTRMRRQVAIKTLPPESLTSPSRVQRFYEEVQAVSQLLHPNIITAFDASEVESERGTIHYLVTEYVEGATLTQTVLNGGLMDVGTAASVIQQAALGLAHAHRAGIVHRDVKPSNLMQTNDGTVKVLDLGLAQVTKGVHEDVIESKSSEKNVDSPPDQTEKQMGSASGSGDPNDKARPLVGTLAFISPEQLENPNAVDSRSDIYSLGATLYFCLTGSPPYSGQYLDQVYGHRHGDVPNLLSMRDDIDANFAEIFRRMMAKKPSERYATLEEVIEDLTPYAKSAPAPVWIADLAKRQAITDTSSFTSASGSTTAASAAVMAIDLGMNYAAAAIGTPNGETRLLSAGGADGALFRMAIAESENGLLFSVPAVDRRRKRNASVWHCIQLYYGRNQLDRPIQGKHCPPEVLTAMMMRRVYLNSWSHPSPASAVAITVPSCYDQMHRSSVMQAATLAGFGTVRLVDRCTAAVQAALGTAPAQSEPAGVNPPDSNSSPASPTPTAFPAFELRAHPKERQRVLFVGLTGLGSEIAVIESSAGGLMTLATAGHWSCGTLTLLHRLTDYAASKFELNHGFDPRTKPRPAADLQLACESALNLMLLSSTATISIRPSGQTQPVEITVSRDEWLDQSEDFFESIRDQISEALGQAGVEVDGVSSIVSMGVLLKNVEFAGRILHGRLNDVPHQHLDRGDVARGAAQCLAAELPGRDPSLMPTRSILSHSIGIFIEDQQKRRRILPVLQRGTPLPVRVNRRVTPTANEDTVSLSVVESAGVLRDNWHTLGKHQLRVIDSNALASQRSLSFDVNVSGLLAIRSAMPLVSESTDANSVRMHTRLPPLPPPKLNVEQAQQWRHWIDSVM
ncbi:MAG: protein kinase [Planctomycetota bacterium]